MPAEPEVIEALARAAIRTAHTLFSAMKDGIPEPTEAARIAHMGTISNLETALNAE